MAGEVGVRRKSLLMATTNQGKQQEIRRILSDLPIDLVSPQDLGLELRVEETGDSYQENALIKARCFSATSGLAALADDSGLEVDALQGAPGIFSARFGGLATDFERNQLLLHKLQGIPAIARTASFVCCIAFRDCNAEEWTVEGRVDGFVSESIQTNAGFGYDPVFLPGSRGKTFGEMHPDEKDRCSHRGVALRLALPAIEKWSTLLQ